MNLEEFLKEIDPDAGWKLSVGGAMRDNERRCPLCHVTYRKGLGDFMVAGAIAAEALKIEYTLRGLIIKAADNYLPFSKLDVDKWRDIRQQLLAATGLKEDF